VSVPLEAYLGHLPPRTRLWPGIVPLALWPRLCPARPTARGRWPGSVVVADCGGDIVGSVKFDEVRL